MAGLDIIMLTHAANKTALEAGHSEMAGLAITMLTHATEGQIPAVTVIEDEQPQETYQNASTSHAKAV